MRYWRARGVQHHDWGGGGDYKQKYGGERVETLHFRVSRVAAIGVARDLARAAYYLPRRIKRKRHLERVDRAEHLELTLRRPSVRALANMRPARIERATSASAGLTSRKRADPREHAQTRMNTRV